MHDVYFHNKRSPEYIAAVKACNIFSTKIYTLIQNISLLKKLYYSTSYDFRNRELTESEVTTNEGVKSFRADADIATVKQSQSSCPRR